MRLPVVLSISISIITYLQLHNHLAIFFLESQEYIGSSSDRILYDSIKMLFSTPITFIFAVVFATQATCAVVDLGNIDIVARQVDCAVYGEFEPFTGPCEATSMFHPILPTLTKR